MGEKKAKKIQKKVSFPGVPRYWGGSSRCL